MGSPEGLPLGLSVPEQVGDCFQALLAGCQLSLDGLGFLFGGVALIQPLHQLEAAQVVESGGDGSVEHRIGSVCLLDQSTGWKGPAVAS